jgi:signal peptidase I
MKLIEPLEKTHEAKWPGVTLPPLRMKVEEIEIPAPAAAPAPAPVQAKPAKTRSFEQQALILFFLFLLSMGSYYLISRFCISAVEVSGRSMTPTLYDGERYVLNRISYLYRDPLPGEVVVIQDPGHSDYAVKRIVAGPSDSVRFEDGKVLVNGKQLREPYLSSNTQTFVPATKPKEIVLGKNQYFVLGDNRGASEDSRFYGAITRDHILGPIMK